MKKNFLFVLLSIIAGVIMYYLTPFIHYVTTFPAGHFSFLVIVLFASIIIFGGIVSLVKSPKGSKLQSLKGAFPIIVLFISMLPHIILSRYNYESGYIIYQYDKNKFGVVNKWGKTVIPKSDYECLCFALGSVTDTYLIGVKNNEETRDVYVYKLKNNHFEPFELHKVTCKESEDEDSTLYDYIVDKIGYPQDHAEEYFSHLYIEKVEKYELKDEIQVGYVEEKEEIEDKEEKEELTKEYDDLGEIVVWYYTGERSPDPREDYHLLVKSVNGDNIYYISKDGKKNLVYRENFIVRDWHFNAYAGDGLYFENPAWPRAEGNKESVDDLDPIPDYSTTQKQELQPRQLQPISVWVPCPACHNSGQCQTCYGQGWTYSASDRYYDGKAPCYNCGGSGKCTTCAGQGGHNEVQYR